MLVPYYRECCRGGVRLTCGVGLLRRYGSEEKHHARNCTPELVLIPFGDIPVDAVTKLFVHWIIDSHCNTSLFKNEVTCFPRS